MNKYLLFLLLGLCFVPNGFGESLLKATAIPLSFNDLSFTERVKILQEGYEPFESEYDENGVCVTNCPYKGITLKEQEEQSRIESDKVWAEIWGEEYVVEDEPSEETKSIISKVDDLDKQKRDEKEQEILRTYPLGAPLSGNVEITSDYGRRFLNGRWVIHDGIDLRASEGTEVFATADGEVVELVSNPRCGTGIKIKHKSGLYTLFCHLNKQLVHNGQPISKGQPIALSGNTGRSTAPHLHYAVIGVFENKLIALDPKLFIWGKGTKN